MRIFVIAIYIIFESLNGFANGIINVKDFGANGDGKNDDTKAIQSAIDNASPLSMTTIYFSKGIYNVASYTITKNYLEKYCIRIQFQIKIVQI